MKRSVSPKKRLDESEKKKSTRQRKSAVRRRKLGENARRKKNFGANKKQHAWRKNADEEIVSKRTKRLGFPEPWTVQVLVAEAVESTFLRLRGVEPQVEVALMVQEGGVDSVSEALEAAIQEVDDTKEEIVVMAVAVAAGMAVVHKVAVVTAVMVEVLQATTITGDARQKHTLLGKRGAIRS
jgi:hypothetical protein